MKLQPPADVCLHGVSESALSLFQSASDLKERLALNDYVKPNQDKYAPIHEQF